MQYRFHLTWAAVLAVVALLVSGGRALAAPPVFQPEVLLIKISGGQHRSFSYAKLKPAATDPKTLTTTFKYKANVEYVTCTIAAKEPDARGVVRADVTIQRSESPTGENPTFKTSSLVFEPGKSQIVDTQSTLMPNGVDGALEMFQLSLAKPETAAAPAPAPTPTPAPAPSNQAAPKTTP